jgi:hypothetical protein
LLMHSSSKNQAERGGEEGSAKEPVGGIASEIRTITQAERDSLREMANEVCTEVFGPGWNKKRGRRR